MLRRVLKVREGGREEESLGKREKGRKGEKERRGGKRGEIPEFLFGLLESACTTNEHK